MAVEYHLITAFGTGIAVTVNTGTDTLSGTALTNHGLRAGHPFRFSTSSTTLPSIGGSQVSASTTYYVASNSLAASTFKITNQPDGSGTPLDITGAGSGVVIVGEYWEALPTSDPGGGLNYKDRYYYGGAYRVYPHLYDWHIGRDSRKNLKTELTLEVEGKWTDSYFQAYTGLTSITGFASVLITSKINGVYGSGYHGGVKGAGFVFGKSFDNGYLILDFNNLSAVVDGIEAGYTALTTNAVSGYQSLYNCILYPRQYLSLGQKTVLANNILIGNGTGTAVLVPNYTQANGAICVNNLVTGYAKGFECQIGGSFVKICNNISIGNTTNWDVTYTPSSSIMENNAGLSTDSVWDSGATHVHITSADFVDLAGGNYYPSNSSLLIDAGVQSFSYFPAYAINNNLAANGNPRPAYNNGGSTQWDIGPYEYDLGYGLAPMSVTFTGILSGSTIRIFPTGSQTPAAESTSPGNPYTPTGLSAQSYDYTIYKDGYIPIRITGVTFYAGISINVSQVVDRAFITPSGLTLDTNAFVNTSTKRFGLTVASTLQNFYSFWIQRYRDTAALYNKPFPFQANGPNSFTMLDGYEFDLTGYPASITNLSRDGLRYVNSSNVTTASWAAILTVGVSSGMRVRYQQTDGGTTKSAAITSGNMDELIQIYGDASHGNFDYTGYLVLKVQEMGYDQAEADAVALYGTLEDQLYVVGLAPTANGVATGNPSLVNPPTVTDHGASPVTWNGKSFSVTITDSAAGNTGTDIMRWLRYYFETGGTFQGKDAFNWHDLVTINGSNFKTVRGKLYGDSGAALKGVRVVRNDGTSAHVNFDLYTSDDGTTYAPPVVATASSTVLADTRVQLYNVTTDTEIDNVFVTGTNYSKVITSEASVGDTLRLRACKLGKLSGESFAVWSASGVTFLISQPEDTAYTAWNINGSTVTEFTLDVTGNIEIDANDVDGATTKTRLGAWFSHILTTANGIRYAFGAISALASNAIRINVDVVDLTIENVNATTALRFTDTEVRLYRSDGTTVISATSYSIHNDYSGVPDVVETGVSGLTTAESNQLFAIPTSGSGSLTTEEHDRLMQALTVPLYLGLK